jgi:dTMP kinase
MSRPIFVTIDALDGVGKTTLVSRLAAHFGGVPMDTPGPALRAVREVVLEGLGQDQLARCVFYLSTVIAEGHRARALVGCGTSVVMDRYWPSTLAYARARGVGEDLDAVVALLPRPDVSVMLTLDEEVRIRRLAGRGDVTAADRETLHPAFRDSVMRCLKATTDLEVDVTGASPDEAVDRVSGAIGAHLLGRVGSARRRG